ncbi:MAG: pentapeptide repeat-containing protein [Ktedonobacteraceae bacterium]
MHNQEPSSNTAHSSQTSPAWRTEPEIDSERQQFLRQRLTIVPDIQQGIYLFKDVALTRADIEWLLITHEDGRGPIEWSDSSQRERQGLDLRGARLQHVNLRGLPLACLRGGLTREEWIATTLEQRALAGVHLEKAELSEAHLEGALLRGAFLQEASLRTTQLEQAVLFQAHLEQAYLRMAHLEGANMMYVHLEGTYLRKAWLTGADLRHAVCDNTTNLEKVTFIDRKWGCALFADVHWGDCNLAVIDWRRVMPLGDEVFAHSVTSQHERASSVKEKQYHLDVYQAAVRAYRQLANAMRGQGMNEEAIPFAYRAQLLQREVHWRYIRWGQLSPSQPGPLPESSHQLLRNLWRKTRSFEAYIFSWFLDILAGYGYKPGRSLSIYLLMIACFTACYLLLGHLGFREALIFSVTAFHGRGFFPGQFKLGDPVTAIAALEAVVGLFIEISFIATFTQRFFGR